jgi:hypothetical protein
MKPEYAFSQLVVKPCLALMILFAALVGLVHLQPQDLNPLLGLVKPSDDCAPPCWHGIRPGVTIAAEAIANLEAHPWVTDVTTSDSRISWRWNGAQPFPANHNDGGSLALNNQIVGAITLETAARLGDVWLLLDQPEQGAFAYLGTVGLPHGYMVKYRTDDMTILAEVNCRSFWERENVTLISSVSQQSGGYSLMRAREASCNPQYISFSS